MKLSELKRLEREAGKNEERARLIEVLMEDGRSFEEACRIMKLTEEETSELRRLTQSDKEQRI